jgi:hypothetical protein
MSLSFATPNQHMTFVDSVTSHIQNAWDLLPNRTYLVSFVIKNDSLVAEPAVTVFVQHSPYGIGLPGTTMNIIQPAPGYVPPMGLDGDGQATVMFHYLTPAGGHSCLNAKIMPGGPILYQNTDVQGVPWGVVSTLSFLVFGSHVPEVMNLTVTESAVPALPPSLSWQPKIIPPGGAPGTTVNVNLPADSFYSIGLTIKPPVPCDNKTHIFHVAGKVGAVDVGSVDLRANPLPPFPPCAPYILGGYQSADVLLTNLATGHPVPLGGMPGGPWDTTLEPNKDYGFAANIHNSSHTPAVNTQVRFWEFPGGVGTAGMLVDIQTATIPALGSVIVHSAHPFHSAPPHHHKCAVVSLYNSMGGGCPDAVTGQQVPDPRLHINHSCSAWRNTESMFVIPGTPWQINLEAINPPIPIPDPVPVEILVHTFYAPAEWANQPQVANVTAALEKAGIGAETPLYMVPSLRETMKPIELKLELKAETGTKVDTFGTAAEVKNLVAKPQLNFQKAFRFNVKDKPVPFTISGVVPDTAKPGDIIQVQIVAHYGETRTSPARDIEFVQVLYVQKG